MNWSDLMAIGFLASTAGAGYVLAQLVARLFPSEPEDLSWRKEPTIGDISKIEIPEVDQLGRREPTLSKEL